MSAGDNVADIVDTINKLLALEMNDGHTVAQVEDIIRPIQRRIEHLEADNATLRDALQELALYGFGSVMPRDAVRKAQAALKTGAGAQLLEEVYRLRRLANDIDNLVRAVAHHQEMMQLVEIEPARAPELARASYLLGHALARYMSGEQQASTTPEEAGRQIKQARIIADRFSTLFRKE